MDAEDKRVLLVDDHSIYRRGLISALQTLHVGIKVHEAENVGDALDALAARPRFDLIVYDWRLRRGDGGRRGLLMLMEGAPGVPVVVLSGVEDDDARLAATSAGAADYILKSADEREVCASLRHWLNRSGRPQLRLAQSPVSSLPALTPRQIEVLRGLARGSENKAIAHDLQISLPTVRGHVSEILRLFKARNRTQAVVMATRAGLV